MTSTTRRPIRLVVADPSSDFRHSIMAQLARQRSVEVVGHAAGANRTVELIADLHPDVALITREVSGPQTPELVERIATTLGRGCNSGSNTHLMVVAGSQPDDGSLSPEEIRHTISIGAHSYLLKDRVEINLVRALHHVADGWSVLDPRISLALARDGMHLQSRVSAESPSHQRLADLSRREQQVAIMIGRGMSNREIANELGLTIYTVKSHVSGVLRKLDLRDRLQVARTLQ